MQWETLNPTLWQYTEETPPATLLRHHRIARYIVYPCMFSSVAMVSSLAQGLAFGFSTVNLWMLVAFAVVALVLTIPTIFAVFWLFEIEANLTKRSLPPPTRRMINQRAPVWALWMMFWSALAVLLPILVSYMEDKS